MKFLLKEDEEALSLIISLLSSMSLLVMVFGDLVNIPLEDNS